jgi:hypothetical protein
MDLTILYAIGVLVLVIGFLIGIKQLKKKGIIDSDDVLFAVKVLDLSIAIVDELDLKNESEIKKISQIVVDALEFAVAQLQDSENVIGETVDYCYEVCDELGIELTDSRKILIGQLVSIGLDNRYAKGLIGE